MNKYEKLIEHIINDNEQAARELFHEIVVEKSRDIYESLMDEEYAEEDIHEPNPVEGLVAVTVYVVDGPAGKVTDPEDDVKTVEVPSDHDHV